MITFSHVWHEMKGKVVLGKLMKKKDHLGWWLKSMLRSRQDNSTLEGLLSYYSFIRDWLEATLDSDDSLLITKSNLDALFGSCHVWLEGEINSVYLFLSLQIKCPEMMQTVLHFPAWISCQEEEEVYQPEKLSITVCSHQESISNESK